MNQIFVLVGKSCSGKDTTLNRLKKENVPNLEFVMPCTSRPIRPNETNGKEYIFFSYEEFQRKAKENELIDVRSYSTANGTWYYGFLPIKGELNCNHILIGTLDTVRYLQRRYPNRRIVTLYMDLPDEDRVQRLLQRNTDFKETCRRYLADEEDFSQSKLKELKNLYRINTSQNIDWVIHKIKEIINAYNRLSDAENTLIILSKKEYCDLQKRLT